jgi:metallo-beta-lactamase family protein
LGRQTVELTITGDSNKKIVFCGDLGRYHDPILFPPHTIRRSRNVYIESTYMVTGPIKQTDREDILKYE